MGSFFRMHTNFKTVNIFEIRYPNFIEFQNMGLGVLLKSLLSPVRCHK